MTEKRRFYDMKDDSYKRDSYEKDDTKYHKTPTHETHKTADLREVKHRGSPSPRHR